MSSMTSHKVVIIGCGNVAWHFAKRLRQTAGCSVSVYNHKKNPVLRRFSAQLKCATSVGLENIERDAAVYLICVADRFVNAVSRKIHCDRRDALVAHTSGSLELEVLRSEGGKKAVIYPLQSFSLKDDPDWKDLPLIVEADTDAAKKKAIWLAKQLGGKVKTTGYSERLRLHLSAVLVNNFVNALYVSAADLLENAGRSKDFALLKPLLQKTLDKACHLGPRAAQTGPALRGDTAVQKRHLNLLRDNKQLQELYKGLSRLIVKQQSVYA